MVQEYDAEVRAAMEHITPGCAIMDVGSNAGHFAAVFLERGYTVISIEPLPQEIAKQALRYEPFVRQGRLCLHNVACSSQAGTATLYVGTFSVESSLEKRWWQQTRRGSWSGQTVEVETIPLRDLVTEYAQHGVRPEFVKVDAEGHDYQVLAGLLDGLQPQLYPKLLMFEFQTKPHERPFFDDSLALLRRHGYGLLKFTVRHGQALLYESDWQCDIGDINRWDTVQGRIPAGFRYGNVIARRG